MDSIGYKAEHLKRNSDYCSSTVHKNQVLENGGRLSCLRECQLF